MGRVPKTHFAIPILAALGLSACTSEIDPIQGADQCPLAPLRGPERWTGEPEDLLIDDFESGWISLPTIADRNGAWILGTDDTATTLVAEQSAHCSARGQRAAHFEIARDPA